jgi:mRNA interferase MazF
VSRRGDLVLVALPGDHGKPRPALVIQSDHLSELASVVLCPVTSQIREADFRVELEPTAANGLRQTSQVMVDKISACSREKVRGVIGHLEPRQVKQVERALLLVAGMA